jgi:hypothetical protein
VQRDAGPGDLEPEISDQSVEIRLSARSAHKHVQRRIAIHEKKYFAVSQSALD